MGRLKLLIVAVALAGGLAMWQRGRRVPSAAHGPAQTAALHDLFDDQCSAAGLDRPVDGRALRGLTVRQALQHLTDTTGANLDPHWDSLGRAGVEPDAYEISALIPAHLTLEQALVRILGSFGGYDVIDRRIVLAERGDLVHASRIYDLHGAIPAETFRQDYVPPLPPTVAIPVSARTSQMISATIQTPGMTAAQRDAAIRAAVATTIVPGTISSATLSGGTIRVTLVPALAPTRVYANLGDYRADQFCTTLRDSFTDRWFNGVPILTTVTSRSLAPPPDVRIESFGGYLFVYQTHQRLREIRRMIDAAREAH